MDSMRNCRKVDRSSSEILQKTSENHRTFKRNSLGFQKELNISSEDNLKEYSRKLSKIKTIVGNLMYKTIVLLQKIVNRIAYEMSRDIWQISVQCQQNKYTK